MLFGATTSRPSTAYHLHGCRWQYFANWKPRSYVESNYPIVVDVVFIEIY